MTTDILMLQSFSNEIPFNPIKSLGKIELKEEGFMSPRFELERVNNFLSNDNIRGDKCSLSGVNDVREVSFEAIRKRLSNDFVGDIAQTDRPKVPRGNRGGHLWN